MDPLATHKEGELFGFIFMCSGVTKPECYLNRVFGLPAVRREVVEKINLGTKLFLFDFDAKLLYGVYEAASKGGMNLKPSAFGGRFPAQVQFEVCNDCLPLPISSFRTAIKDNYQGSKFTPELNAQQVRDLLLLFKPIVAPSTTSLNPAADYAAPGTQMLALAPNGVPGPRMPPESNGWLNSSLTPYSQNCYRPHQVGPLHNCSQQITQPQFVLRNELNPHLHRPTPHQAPPVAVNPYEFAENQPPYLSNEPYTRYAAPGTQKLALEPNGVPGPRMPAPASNGRLNSSLTPYSQNCYRAYQVGPLHNCSQQITQPQFVLRNELNPHLHRPTPHQAPPAPVNPYEFAENQPPYLSNEPYSRYAAPVTQKLALEPNGVPGPRMPAPASNGRLNSSLTPYSQNCYRPYQVGPLHNCSQQITQPQFVLRNELNPHLHHPTPHQAPPAPVNPYEFAENQPPYLSNEPYSRYAAPGTQKLALEPNGVPGPRMPAPASNGRLNSSLTPYSQNCYRPYQVGPLHNCSQQITQPQLVLRNELNPHLHRPTPHQVPPAPVNPYEFAENQPPYLSNEPYSRYTATPEVDPRDQTVGLDGEHSGQVLQPVHNHVDGYPQGHNSYAIPKPSYVSSQGPHLTTQPSYSDPIYMQLLQYVLSTSILQLIGVSNEEADFSVNTTPITKMTSKERKKASRKRRKALKKRKKALKGIFGLSMLDFRLTKSKTFGESSKIKKREKDKIGTYRAVSFISSGKMESEPEMTSFDESKPRHQTPNSSNYGAFETHTTGFGSKMLAKMGFVDGGGLGKDGRGIAEPIQVIERPKLLGLGAMAPEI